MIKKSIINVIKVLMLLIMVWILLLLVFFENVLEYACEKQFLVSNIYILFFLIIVYIAYYFIKKSRFYEKAVSLIIQYMDKLVIVGVVIFFFLQLYISYNIFFETGWDSGAYVIPAARIVSQHGEITEGIDNYFSTYPNNLFLVNIYAAILKINEKVGIFCGEEQIMSIVLCNCLVSSLTCLLVFEVGKKLVDKQCAFIGYLLSIVLVGLSPWMVICYSDSLALFIPILILYVYLSRIPVFWKTIILCLCGYIGYNIKPQAIISLLAVLLVSIINMNKKMLKNKNILKCFCGVMISIVLVSGISCGLNKIYRKEGFSLDHEKRIGMTHFLMMGMNPDRLGVWSGEDVQISSECNTVKERTKKNLEIIQERLKEYGLDGYFKLLSQKMLTNFNDGTFAWGEEGGFYAVMKEDKNTVVAPRLKAIFYNDGAYFLPYSTVLQTIWITVLILCFANSFFSVFGKVKENNVELIIILSLIGITFFELLFEARARYIYIYIPVFILYGILGIKKVKVCIERRN